MHTTLRRCAVLLALALAMAASLIAQQSSPYDPALWSGLRYRMIGPYRGGRVTTVTGVPSQPATFYMGSTGGGVWKTTDAGHNWTNVSDGQIPLGSIGAVEVALSDPNIIYAGTGSSKIRSNVSIGRGIYKSTDAGKTWAFAGLRDTGQISTIRIHPTNPDVVYVAALGNPNVVFACMWRGERKPWTIISGAREGGIFKSVDGGENWTKLANGLPSEL